MTSGTIALERQDGVAVLSLNRPDAGNSMSMQLVEDLRDAAAEVAGDGAVRAVLLRGNGANFCVGGDLKEFSELGDQITPTLRRLADVLHEGVRTLHELEVPLVVAVQGAAAGAGLSLACLGDVCLAARSAKFRVAYTAVGLSPDGGGSWLLPRLVGPRLAAELALTNRTLRADEAAAVGLVSRVVDDESLHDEAAALAATLAAGATTALKAAKRLLHQSPTASFEEQLVREAESIATLAGGPEGQEGIAAFVGKRAPTYH